jgi:heptosyltransferase-3
MLLSIIIPLHRRIELPAKFNVLLAADKFNLILHPKSNGSGAEWGLDKFKELAEVLPSEKFKLFITGSDREQVLLKDWIKTLPKNVVDLTGQMALDELIAFMSKADGLLASGTGPLHVAAALGINVLGLFPSIRPIHPGRWGPIGKKAQVLESGGGSLDDITVDKVAAIINSWV